MDIINKARMVDYVRQQSATIDSIPAPIPDVEVFNAAWALLPFLQATEFKVLPEDGGFLEQDSVLMEQILRLLHHFEKTKEDAHVDDWLTGG
ncbi:MAG: hypothetical protein D6712_20900 [Chloroflexi bacterium]|nr:MAG: hypothetical protein D6712_20900 [Chloroflexota bacterium]